MNSSLEILEARIAPATLVGTNTVTYTDVDGDAVTIKTTAGVFVLATHFDFVGAGILGGEQLRGIDLGADAAFAKASLTITAKAVPGGDGFVNIGAIFAQIDLGKVTINGDLGVIQAGDGGATQPALAALTVQSMGRYGIETQAPGATLVSTIEGTLASFTAKTELRDVQINVNGALTKLTAGTLIGGDADFSGRIVVTGNLGATKITRDVRGGIGASTGTIEASGSITSLAIAGSVIGNTGDNSARISSGTTMGKVSIVGSLIGVGADSGVIHAAGAITSVALGAIFGGAGVNSGSVTSDASIGPVKIKVGIDGGAGDHSGEIFAGTTLGAVTLGGSLTGDTGPFSGRIAATGALGAVKIGGDVRGGSGENSGVLESDTSIKSATLGGSLIGGPASFTGAIFTEGSIGTVTIAGDVIGGDAEFDGVTVDGTGTVRAARLPSVTIGGSVISGSNHSNTGTLGASAVIFASDDIGKLVIKGDLIGSADATASIIARGQPNLAMTATTDVAIKSILISGSVDRALIDASFGDNADAQIGTVTITGDWSRSSIAAGFDPVNGRFGGLDDVLSIGDPDDRAGIFSRINSIIIKGQALGAPDGTGEFGFVAESIGAMKVGKGTIPLTAGDDVIAIGATGDLMLREI